MSNNISYLPVDWPEITNGKLKKVHALTTLRKGGVSSGEFSAFNLAKHVGDDESSVDSNRAKLSEDCQLPSEPVWLEQIHSNVVIRADEMVSGEPVQADASVTGKKSVICAVMTADCLPVFFCNQAGTEVAVAHAGWRGLHAGIISNTVAAMHSAADELLVSLGPAIGPQVFEVGQEVFNAFVSKNSKNTSAFIATTTGHYICDIYELARIELRSIGVFNIAGGDYCTFSDEEKFYSFRRNKITGRMASLIWMD